MYRILKRLIDISGSTLGILALLPILISVSIILRFTGEGEVFYRQKRVGYRNQHFKIIKFATMLRDSPNMAGGEITVRHDPRVLPFGHLLRLTKINELPQLINIIKGDMSLVGPRPLMQISFDQYSPEVKAAVIQSRPGLTGIGSLVFRDEEQLLSRCGNDPRKFYTEEIFPYKGRLELWYLRNRGFLTDSKIILLTAWYIIFPRSTLIYRFFPDLPRSTSE